MKYILIFLLFAGCAHSPEMVGEEDNLDVYSVILPKITIHYVENHDLMPKVCGDAPGCVIWRDYNGERTEDVWILSKKTVWGISSKSYHVLGHEIQHIVNRTDYRFINPDLNKGDF